MFNFYSFSFSNRDRELFRDASRNMSQAREIAVNDREWPAIPFIDGRLPRRNERTVVHRSSTVLIFVSSDSSLKQKETAGCAPGCESVENSFRNGRQKIALPIVQKYIHDARISWVSDKLTTSKFNYESTDPIRCYLLMETLRLGVLREKILAWWTVNPLCYRVVPRRCEPAGDRCPSSPSLIRSSDDPGRSTSRLRRP